MIAAPPPERSRQERDRAKNIQMVVQSRKDLNVEEMQVVAKKFLWSEALNVSLRTIMMNYLGHTCSINNS